MNTVRRALISGAVLLGLLCAGCEPPQGVRLGAGRYTRLLQLLPVDGGYYALATLAQSTPEAIPRFTVFRLSNALDIEWGHAFNEAGAGLPHAALASNGDLLIAFGTTVLRLTPTNTEQFRFSVASDILEVAGAPGDIIYVLTAEGVSQLNAIGSVQWTWQPNGLWPGIAALFAVDIVPAQDGGVFLVANHLGVFNADIHVARITQDGGVTWALTFEDESLLPGDELGSDWKAGLAAPTADGGLLLAGSIPALSPGTAGDAFLLRLGADGGVLWDAHGALQDKNVAAIAQTAEGDVVAACTPTLGRLAFSPINLHEWRQQRRHLVAVRYNDAGQFVWQREFGTGFGNRGAATAVAPDPDGGCVLGGTYERRHESAGWDGPALNSLLIPLDSDGTAR